MNITTLNRIMLIPVLATLFSSAAMADTSSQPNILWHNSTTGAIKFMPVNGMTPENTLSVVDSSNTNLLPKGMGDFTGDGKPDILFHNQNSGNLRIWEMDGTSKVENIQVLGSANTNLQIAGIGDFDGDGDNDIATFNTNSGALRIWVMEGTTRVDNVLVLTGANTNLVPRGAGDMDNDGIPDIVLRNNNSGAVRVWTMNSDFTRKGNEYVTGSSNTNLELRGVIDINGDGNNDILNYNVATGKLRAWLMDGDLVITDNAEVIQDTALEWSVRGGLIVSTTIEAPFNFTTDYLNGKSLYFVRYDDFGYDDKKWNMARMEFTANTFAWTEYNTVDAGTHTMNYTVNSEGNIVFDYGDGNDHIISFNKMTNDYIQICQDGDCNTYLFFDEGKAKAFRDSKNDDGSSDPAPIPFTQEIVSANSWYRVEDGVDVAYCNGVFTYDGNNNLTVSWNDNGVTGSHTGSYAITDGKVVISHDGTTETETLLTYENSVITTDKATVYDNGATPPPSGNVKWFKNQIDAEAFLSTYTNPEASSCF